MFIAALLIIAKNQKQPKRPSIGEWINKMWYFHAMENYSYLKRNEVMMYATTWMNLEILTTEARYKKQNIVRSRLYEMSKRGKFMETESRLVAVQGQRGWEDQGMMAKECRVSFQGDKNVLKWIGVMVTQLCEYTKNHCIV